MDSDLPPPVTSTEPAILELSLAEIDEQLEDMRGRLADLDTDFHDARAEYHRQRHEIIADMMDLQTERRARQ